MSVPMGGAAGVDSAYHSSGGVQDTVDPADTILTPQSKMYRTIALTDDQVRLVSEMAETVNKESKGEVLDPERSKVLYESLSRETLMKELRQLHLPSGKVQVTRMTTKARRFDVKDSDAVLAIELADSKAERYAQIRSPADIPYQWPRNEAPMLTKDWRLESDEDIYLFLLKFKVER
ncbi:hypothetical protein ARSEF4850_001422 [Beauveria asiatica]